MPFRNLFFFVERPQWAMATMVYLQSSMLFRRLSSNAFVCFVVSCGLSSWLGRGGSPSQSGTFVEQTVAFPQTMEDVGLAFFVSQTMEKIGEAIQLVPQATSLRGADCGFPSRTSWRTSVFSFIVELIVYSHYRRSRGICCSPCKKSRRNSWLAFSRVWPSQCMREPAVTRFLWTSRRRQQRRRLQCRPLSLRENSHCYGSVQELRKPRPKTCCLLFLEPCGEERHGARNVWRRVAWEGLLSGRV